MLLRQNYGGRSRDGVHVDRLVTPGDWLHGALSLVFVGRLAWRQIFPALSVQAHYSPKGGCTEIVVAEIKRARREILVLAYSFTSREIAEALVEAKLRGVTVELVLDHSNEHDAHSDLHFFLAQGMHPLVDAQHAIAHNKVMVLDQRTLLTGSFNFTQQAELHNAENLLVIRGHSELIQHYRANFASHKAHSRAPQIQAPQQTETASKPALALVSQARAA